MPHYPDWIRGASWEGREEKAESGLGFIAGNETQKPEQQDLDSGGRPPSGRSQRTWFIYRGPTQHLSLPLSFRRRRSGLPGTLSATLLVARDVAPRGKTFCCQRCRGFGRGSAGAAGPEHRRAFLSAAYLSSPFLQRVPQSPPPLRVFQIPAQRSWPEQPHFPGASSPTSAAVPAGERCLPAGAAVASKSFP